jgi:predicted ATPase
MQKIVIKNFGPITDAEIELKKTVVLIGEQATGKSTIAKLIYYFKSLRDDLFNKIYQSSVSNDTFEFNYTTFLLIPSREKFYDFFGSTMHMRDFEITFYYDVDRNKYLKLTLNQDKKLDSYFSDSFNLKEVGTQIKGIRKMFISGKVNEDNISEVLLFNQEKLKYAEKLSNILKELFNCKQEEELFVISGRNATVGYSESFENQFLLDAHTQYAEKLHEKSFRKKQQTIDETLMLDFMKRVVAMKGLLKKFGGFEGFIKTLNNPAEKEKMKAVLLSIEDIMKGKYKIDTFGEHLIISNLGRQERVGLSNSSSGQQEVIRILQDIFLTILYNKNVLRIVEEPEAHLFPIAQKIVIELLMQMANNNDNNQLIITTHSPYVLTVLNNLLFAQRVIDKNNSAEEEISRIISKESRMKADDFSAYVLQNEDGNVSSKSIIDGLTGMITQNYLDTVSEMLSNEFNALYEIHAKTFLKP